MPSSSPSPASQTPTVSWRTRLPFFYGWVVLASAILTLTIGYGVFYSFSVFYVAMLADSGWTRAETAGVFSTFVLVTAAAGVAGGALIDRIGPARVVPVGGILLALGLFASSRLTALWEYYLYFGVVCGLALALAGWVPCITVVSRWFSRRRGLAMGMASAGVGLGIVVYAPFSQHLISTIGWRAAYETQAWLALLGIAPQAALLLVGEPSELGLHPDGAAEAENPSAARRKAGTRQMMVLDKEWASRAWSLADSVCTRRLWLLTATMTLCVLTNQMMWVHQAAFLVDGGYDKMLAASVVGLSGLISMPAKIFWGDAGDRLGRERALTLGTVAMLSGIGLLLLTRVISSPVVVFLFATGFAVGYASASITVSTATADLFAGKDFGAIYGFVCAGQGIGGALGAWVAGWVFDVTGSYLAAFALGATSFIVATVCMWLAAPRQVRRMVG